MIILRRGRKRRKKPISDSAIENQKIVLSPQQLHPQGLFFGGSLLQVVEKYALSVAKDHSGFTCHMEGIDFVRFFSPVRKGDILLCSASVNRTWGSMLEVGLKLIADDFRLLEKKKVLSAYFNLLATNEDGDPVVVIEALAQTKAQLKRYIEADKRKVWREKHSFPNKV